LTGPEAILAVLMRLKEKQQEKEGIAK